MSGTSLEGADAAVIETDGDASRISARYSTDRPYRNVERAVCTI
jgi:hypothetical protein